MAPALAATAAASAASPDQTWTINIKNADIREFVTQVAEITGETFVVDPRLKGEVTVISSTPLNADGIYELFLSVLRVHGFIASPSGDVIRIQQSATGKQTPGLDDQLSHVAPEELVTRVIAAAQNVESTELVKILRPLIPQYGHIAAVAEPNIVIISDHADNILRLMRIIEQIDVAEEDEIVVVPLQEAWVETVVELLERLAPSQIGGSATGPQSIQIIANKRNNSLIVRGKPRPVAEILKIVELIDKPATAHRRGAGGLPETRRRGGGRRGAQGHPGPALLGRRQRAGSNHPGRRIAERNHHSRRPERHGRDSRHSRPARYPAHPGTDRGGRRRSADDRPANHRRGDPPPPMPKGPPRP